LRVYVDIYNSMIRNLEKPLLNWYNAYTKMMWAMARDLGLDLATLTRDEIEPQGLPCRRVKDAVQAGYLPRVKGFETLQELF